MYDFPMPPLDWTTFRIPKKSGGVRVIHAPNAELKNVQRDILHYLYGQKDLRVSGFAHGFVPGRGCMSAVLKHSRNTPVILCMDVKDFFDNCPVEPARNALLRADIGHATVDKILEVCTLDGRFPQGSPISPWITNIVMKECDLMISAYAKREGFVYTRYADDIQLSLNPKWCTTVKKDYTYIFHGIEKIISSKLGLQLKHSKNHTIWMRGSEKPQILGVVLRKDGLGYNAPRKLRKKVRAMVYNLSQKIRKQKGRARKEDHSEFLKIYGYVQYFDTIRSHGDAEAATADPVIQEDHFNYLCKKFKIQTGELNGNTE